MALAYDARRTTEDVDAIFVPAAEVGARRDGSRSDSVSKPTG